MTQSKHIKGPWGCTTRQGSWDWVVFSEADPNIEICQMFHDGTDMNEVGEANARLCASAPDMLAALKWAESAIAPFSKEPAEKSGMSLIRRAIAKAEGRQPSPARATFAAIVQVCPTC